MGSVGDELVEVVDETGAVLRVVTRAEMRRDNLMHRNVAVFLQRTDGRLVVHQRADWKDVYPSHWDVAFGGVPNVGESDEDAAIRELAEEAGLTVAPRELIDLGVRTQANAEVRWYARFFTVRTDADLYPADGGDTGNNKYGIHPSFTLINLTCHPAQSHYYRVFTVHNRS